MNIDTWLDILPKACDVLRPYQRQQIDQIRAAMLAGHRRILVQLPTGGGKTHEIAALALAAESAGLRVLILATRTRLIRQIRARLLAFGLRHGIIAASLKQFTDHGRRVQVASVDTLHRRCVVGNRSQLPGADVVIFDEAHLALAATRVAILERYPDAVLIGMTATPARRSGRALREQFDVLIAGLTVRELIQAGQLVRPRVFNVPVIAQSELDGIPKDASRDYQAGALSTLMTRPKLVGDVVENWARIAAGKRTLVFSIDKAHGQSLVEQFCRAGVAAELLTDADDEDTREAVVSRLEAGITTIIVNCFLMSYGVDVPSVECVVIARPTRSVVLYLQCVGRGLRTAEGKEHCIVIDHGRVIENLGLPTDDFAWSLNESSNVNEQASISRQRACADEGTRTCPECMHMWRVSEEGNRCTCCGWEPKPKPRAVATTAAMLVELGGDATATSPHSAVVALFFAQAIAYYARSWPHRYDERANSGRSWAWHRTCERFGFTDEIRMPSDFWSTQPSESISASVGGWLLASKIRYSKSRGTPARPGSGAARADRRVDSGAGADAP